VHAVALFDEVARTLQVTATLKPLVVVDGAPHAILANHRRDLDAYVTEARQKMYSIREELGGSLPLVWRPPS